MSWTHQRVAMVAGLIMAIHLVAIFSLHTRQPILARIATAGNPKSLPPGPESPASRAGTEGLDDPLAFASAHPAGFSASAWMAPPLAQYASANPIPAPDFLAFHRSPPDFTRTSETMAQKPSLPMVRLTMPVRTNQSGFSITGSLSRRALAREALPVPVQFANDVLSNTVVQLGVRSDGYPFTARITSGSGSRAADLSALHIARNIRFAAAGSTNLLEWGELNFHWFTAEPPSTNAAPSK